MHLILQTSSACATLLYQLAKNPEKQDKLRLEVMELLPNIDSKFTAEGLDKLPYLRACLKESLRIQSVVPGIQRATGQNIVLDGFKVPKDASLSFNEITFNLNNLLTTHCYRLILLCHFLPSQLMNNSIRIVCNLYQRDGCVIKSVNLNVRHQSM